MYYSPDVIGVKISSRHELNEKSNVSNGTLKEKGYVKDSGIEDNIKVDIKILVREYAEYIELAQTRSNVWLLRT